jgi:scyllo-inositol 2-dehydrogenase (NADP+)
MEKVIKTGLLAYGMSGKVFHAPFIQEHQGFDLVAIVERHQKKAVNDYPEVTSFDAVEDLLKEPSIELVIINTPNYTHFEYAKMALLQAKHILVEKPFTATSAEAKELFSLAKTVGKQIFFYQNRRWDSDFTAVKNIIKHGVLGKLNEVHFRFDRYRSTISPKAFKEEPVAASGIQYDLGPHLLDQVISIFGKPERFYKVLGKNRAETQVDDFFSIHLSYPDSVNVFVSGNMLVTDPQPAYVLHGHKGSFVKQRTDVQEDQLLQGIKPTAPEYGKEEKDREGILTTIDAAGQKTQELVPAEKGDYKQLFNAIYESIAHHQAYPVKEEEIIWQLEILEAQA